GIRSGHQHGVDFLRAAHLLGRIEGQRDVVLPGRLLRFVQPTSRQRSDAAVLRQREPRHQPFDRVQSKPENPKANQEWAMWRGRPRPRFLHPDFGVTSIPARRMAAVERLLALTTRARAARAIPTPSLREYYGLRSQVRGRCNRIAGKPPGFLVDLE